MGRLWSARDFLINRDKKIIYRHVGAITKKDLEKIKLILDNNK